MRLTSLRWVDFMGSPPYSMALLVTHKIAAAAAHEIKISSKPQLAIILNLLFYRSIPYNSGNL